MIITAISTAEVRVVLRVYFLILLALTGYLARKILHDRVRIRILGNDSVPATRILSSLDGLDLLLAPLRLRAFPSGPFGFAFLLLLFAIGKAADLLTSYLVISQPIQSRCAFGQGLVFNDGHTNFPMPPFNGRPVQVVQNAQLLAVNHSCPYGIYKKLNTDFQFCPDKRDILGSWNCNARNTLGNMASVKALRSWSPIFQGLMYWGTNTTAIPDIPDALAMLLNTMTMISGGSNYLLATPPAGEDTSQGCRKPAAYVPSTMVGIVVVVTVLCVLTCSAWCTIAIRLCYAKRSVQWPKSAREVEALPLSVEEWATFGAREHAIAAAAQGRNVGNAVALVKAKGLKDYSVEFSQVDPRRVNQPARVRILRTGDRLQTGGGDPVEPGGSGESTQAFM
ncbi:uncharacterized protein FTOL_13891 [Fusarium torulosum]|uniref:Uncharacterized protein n=1 Tax=Fusarium torulosum TaxID=33205 RepID=A0AAE8SQN2_9HYPO|nr:uncharacterized protein FTOL_13891 [Fusarium torulosum]